VSSTYFPKAKVLMASQILLSLILTLLLITASAVFTGCSSLPADFIQNKELWQGKGISDYTYVVGITPKLAWPDITVTVREKTLVTTEPELQPNAFLGDITSTDMYTVEYLFDVVERYLRDGGWQVSVRYDSEYGFPAEFHAVGKSVLSADSFVVSNFAQIPAPLGPW
jgi:hypothetical protein